MKVVGSYYLLFVVFVCVKFVFVDVVIYYLMFVDGCVVFECGSVDVWIMWDFYVVLVDWNFDVWILVDGNGFVLYQCYYFVLSSFVVVCFDVVQILFDQLLLVGMWLCDYLQEVVIMFVLIWGFDVMMIVCVNV